MHGGVSSRPERGQGESPDGRCADFAREDKSDGLRAAAIDEELNVVCSAVARGESGHLGRCGRSVSVGGSEIVEM